MTEDDFTDDTDRVLDVLDFGPRQLGYHAAEDWETDWNELYKQEVQPWLSH
jgi:hypothetical protein